MCETERTHAEEDLFYMNHTWSWHCLYNVHAKFQFQAIYIRQFLHLDLLTDIVYLQ